MVLAPDSRDVRVEADAPSIVAPAPPDDAGSPDPRRRYVGAVLTRLRPRVLVGVRRLYPLASSLVSLIRRLTAPVRAAVTGTGALVIGIAVTAWLGGWLLGWHELMVISAACIVALAIGALFTVGRLRVDVATTLVPERVVVGQQAGTQVTVRNTAGGRVFPLTVEVRVGRGVAQLDVPMLIAGAEHAELFEIPTHRRAVIPVGPARSLRTDPLNMLQRSVTWPTVTDLYVHPRTVALDSLGAGLLRDLEGRTTDDTSTSDVELHTLRDYVPGDDRRFVHWRTSARSGRLMVRQFVDTRQSHVALLLSGRPEDYATEEDFETAVSVVASLGVRAVRDCQPLTVIAAGRRLPTASPRALLDGASGIAPGAPQSTLVDAAAQASRGTGGGVTLAFLVTGGRSPLAAVRSAGARFAPDVRSIAVRVDAAGPAGLRRVGAMPVLSLAGIDDLPALIRIAGRA